MRLDTGRHTTTAATADERALAAFNGTNIDDTAARVDAYIAALDAGLASLDELPSLNRKVNAELAAHGFGKKTKDRIIRDDAVLFVVAHLGTYNLVERASRSWPSRDMPDQYWTRLLAATDQSATAIRDRIVQRCPPHLHAGLHTELAFDTSAKVRASVASWTSHTELHWTLATDSHPDVVAAVVHATKDPELIRVAFEATSDADPTVLRRIDRAVIQNRHTPADVLKEIAGRVPSRGAAQTVEAAVSLASHPNTPPDVLDEFSHPTVHVNVRAAAARNPNTAPAAVRRLAADKSKTVAVTLLRSRTLPPDLFTALASRFPDDAMVSDHSSVDWLRPHADAGDVRATVNLLRRDALTDDERDALLLLPGAFVAATTNDIERLLHSPAHEQALARAVGTTHHFPADTAAQSALPLVREAAARHLRRSNSHAAKALLVDTDLAVRCAAARHASAELVFDVAATDPDVTVRLVAAERHELRYAPVEVQERWRNDPDPGVAAAVASRLA